MNYKANTISESIILILMTLFISTACQQTNQGSTPVARTNPDVRPTITSPSTAVPLTVQPAAATPTPTITPTPPPTATPTATAVPATITGDPRSTILSDPIPSGSAPCGVVDLFDFPIDPPHAYNARGGGDFGVWRSRFEKYHAGEDWGKAGGTNLGEPVYSIGHGLVTYAEPEGWGRDQGVVIIRHTFADGQTVLSFYGHLEVVN